MTEQEILLLIYACVMAILASVYISAVIIIAWRKKNHPISKEENPELDEQEKQKRLGHHV